MTKDVKAGVLYNSHISGSYFRLGLRTCWTGFDPGQFVMVRVPDDVVFLRRPFSVSRAIDGGIELLCKVVGPGTGRMARLKEGEEISVLGPLGKGFSLSSFDSAQDDRKAVLVAGGFGIAPFVGLVGRLSGTGADIKLYYGGRTAEDILFVDEFESKGVLCQIATEDGSQGHKGLITELLVRDIHGLSENACHSRESGNPVHVGAKDPCFSRDDIHHTTIFGQPHIYACGPEGLIKAVTKIAAKNRIPAEVSYETYMGCGIGVCLGCAVETKEGYKRACREGPVFIVDSY